MLTVHGRRKLQPGGAVTRAHGRKPDVEELSQRINDVKSMYGIREQRLENLLA